MQFYVKYNQFKLHSKQKQSNFSFGRKNQQQKTLLSTLYQHNLGVTRKIKMDLKRKKKIKTSMQANFYQNDIEKSCAENSVSN